jgi:hypothetical protein
VASHPIPWHSQRQSESPYCGPAQLASSDHGSNVEIRVFTSLEKDTECGQQAT